MALLTARFWSPVLEKQAELHAIVPEIGRGPFPVLYLLHGGGDDSSNWARWSRIEHHARRLPLVVAMPDGHHGFSVDHHEGPAYGRYLREDVIGFVERTLPVRADRAGRAIGGLSMGGYGALHQALSRPESFASAHSHSGCFGLWGRHVAAWGEEPTPAYAAMLRRLHGPRQEGSELDLFALARDARRGGAALPALRLDCGLSDALLGANREFAAHLAAIGIPHAYHEAPGRHDWDYWDAAIVDALAFHALAVGIAAG